MNMIPFVNRIYSLGCLGATISGGYVFVDWSQDYPLLYGLGISVGLVATAALMIGGRRLPGSGKVKDEDDLGSLVNRTLD